LRENDGYRPICKICRVEEYKLRREKQGKQVVRAGTYRHTGKTKKLPKKYLGNNLTLYTPIGKICIECGEQKDATEFAKNRCNKDRLRNICKQCNNKISKQKRLEDPRIKEREGELYTERREFRIPYIYNYLKEHGCADCEEKDPIVLTFDHVRGKKAFTISSSVMNHNWDEILNEIAKCDVVCANCHAKRTVKQRDYYNIDKFKDNLNKLIGHAKASMKIIIRNREYVYNILDNSECCECGVKGVAVLEFHHLHDKIALVGRLVSGGYSIKTIQNEIDKCIILCSNCHKRETAKVQNWYREVDREAIL
jgi:hypothetical protein